MTDPTGRVFDALADPNRRYVLEALASRETATATELAAELPVTRQAVAKHLAALNQAGLVESRREGTGNALSVDAGAVRRGDGLDGRAWAPSGTPASQRCAGT